MGNKGAVLRSRPAVEQAVDPCPFLWLYKTGQTGYNRK